MKFLHSRRKNKNKRPNVTEQTKSGRRKYFFSSAVKSYTSQTSCVTKLGLLSRHAGGAHIWLRCKQNATKRRDPTILGCSKTLL